MCSKFRTVSAIFTDVWCIQEPQVAKCWYGNIEQRKWCRTTEIWRIGVNENVRQFFGQCEVNPRQSWMIWIPRCGSRIPSTGFWIPCFRIPADFLSWTPRIPDSTSKDLPGFRNLDTVRYTLYGAKYPYLHGAKLFSTPPLCTFLCYQHTHCFHVIN